MHSAVLCLFIILPYLTPSRARETSHWWHFLRGRSSDANSKKVPPEGYYDPRTNGGSMITSAPGTGGLGEPVNAILSGASDEAVLSDNEDKGGLQNYFISIGFAGECLGQHAGSDQGLDLGDGNGSRNETAVIRWDYGDPSVGTCKESVQGGNHFRYWIQNGPKANSGAVFMAISYEMPIKSGHDIVRNGYNLGRDWLVGNITRQDIPRFYVNTTLYTAQLANTSAAGYTYSTDIKYVTGLLKNSSAGINHFATVEVDGLPAIDGIVAILTVKVTERPKSDAPRRIRPLDSSLSLIVPFSTLCFLPLLNLI